MEFLKQLTESKTSKKLGVAGGAILALYMLGIKCPDLAGWAMISIMVIVIFYVAVQGVIDVLKVWRIEPKNGVKK